MRACSIFTCQKMCRGPRQQWRHTHKYIWNQYGGQGEFEDGAEMCSSKSENPTACLGGVSGDVSIVSRWCLGGVLVVSRWCLPQWCLAQASLVSRWCLGDVLAEFPLHLFFCVQKKHATLVDF